MRSVRNEAAETIGAPDKNVKEKGIRRFLVTVLYQVASLNPKP